MKANKSDILDMCKAVLLAVVFSIVLVMLFALVVKFANLNEKVIAGVNIGIKVASIFAGCLVGMKSCQLGLVKGIVVGLFFGLVSFLIFSLINKSFVINPLTAVDIITEVVAGAISGICSVNLRAMRAKK
ncbi:MAG: TIGR04086 family membrane protein [Clostridia bacterium]